MLANKEVLATIGVKDIGIARKFYEGTLGLTPSGSEEPGILNFNSGGATLMVYESAYAGSNQATSATWMVGRDIGNIVAALKEKGVVFEHYDFPSMTMDGDIHVMGKIKAAWLKDPDGNILNLAGE